MICDAQVFRVLTGCQRDPRVLGCHNLHGIRAEDYEYLGLEGHGPKPGHLWCI